MQPITKEQRKAIKKVFDRGPVFEGDKLPSQLAMEAGWSFIQHPEHGYVWVHNKVTPIYRDAEAIVTDYRLAKRLTYLQFRRTVTSGFDCLMVRWAGMWLGIERDGYVHS